MRNGIIRESNSEYSHPVVCVLKKDSSIRMTVDMRYVNSGTIPDRYPMKMKRVDDILKELSNSDWLTCVDCTQGYYAISMDPASVHLTSFVTHKGQYECLYLPFGLKNSDECYKRALGKVLKPLH